MSSPASPPPPPTLLDQTTGHCACKRTTFTVRLNNISSDLRLSAYCHCSQCQRLNGAPFIWTTHWAEDAVHWSSTTAPPNDDADSDPAVIRPLTRGGARLIPHEGPIPFIPPYMPDPSFAPSMAVYEAMPMRKWKLRCDHCGTPLGSWNQAKKQWSIWPSTLTRDYHDDDDATSSDDAHIHPAVQKAIAPDHHQFYGPWKLMLVNDDLPKFVGYRGSREQVG